MLKLELQSNPQKASIKPLKPHNPKWCGKKKNQAIKTAIWVDY